MKFLLRKFLISNLVLNLFILFFILSLNKNLYAADKSLSFDGTDDFVEIAANNVLNPTGDYTVAAWFKQEGETSGANNWQSVVTSRQKNSDGDAQGYVMYLRKSDSKLQYWKGIPVGSWATIASNEQSTWKTNGGGNPGTPGWNHWVIRYNGSNQMDLFLDGAFIQSTTSELNLNRQNTTRPTRIGAGATENDAAEALFFFKGKIDDVAVWDEALTDAEISELYNGAVPGFNGSEVKIKPSIKKS